MRQLVLALLLCACDREPEGPSRELVDDVAVLQRVVTSDRELGALEEVDEAVADDLPVRAAELLRVGALPAARRHLEQVEAVQVSTAEGRRLKGRAVRLIRRRVQALDRYREVLERGLMEDVELLQSLHDQRETEEELADLLAELEVIRPLAQQRINR